MNFAQGRTGATESALLRSNSRSDWPKFRMPLAATCSGEPGTHTDVAIQAPEGSSTRIEYWPGASTSASNVSDGEMVSVLGMTCPSGRTMSTGSVANLRWSGNPRMSAEIWNTASFVRLSSALHRVCNATESLYRLSSTTAISTGIIGGAGAKLVSLRANPDTESNSARAV
jgi:hypothetical protein